MTQLVLCIGPFLIPDGRIVRPLLLRMNFAAVRAGLLGDRRTASLLNCFVQFLQGDIQATGFLKNFVYEHKRLLLF